MARHKSPFGVPTASELEILQVLWKHGPGTVRFINGELLNSREVAYTSTLKIIQLMYDKEMVSRDDREMTHIYKATLKEGSTKKLILRSFLHSVFGGSRTGLFCQLFQDKKLSKEELALIKKFIRETEKK